jgi:uncharacterized protein YbaR (Trm112 family)
MNEEIKLTEYKVVMRFGNYWENTHTKTYTFTTETDDDAVEIAKRVAKGWSENPQNPASREIRGADGPTGRYRCNYYLEYVEKAKGARKIKGERLTDHLREHGFYSRRMIGKSTWMLNEADGAWYLIEDGIPVGEGCIYESASKHWKYLERGSWEELDDATTFKRLAIRNSKF